MKSSVKNYLPYQRMLFAVIAYSILTINATAQSKKREYYQLTTYYYVDASQEKIIDDYLQLALLPALHRMTISNVGVFKSIANDTAANKTIYILVPLNNLGAAALLPDKLAADKAYQQAGEDYINATYKSPPYKRMETVLLQAFSLAPKMQLPALNGPRTERVYELRSYESATEKIFKNKVHMFNEGDEIGLFKRLGFNAIFYAEVVSGAHMPNLMYMTSFENRADRDAHWKAFSADPQWKQLSSMPVYKNNVSHIDIMFLRPTLYSDY